MIGLLAFIPIISILALSKFISDKIDISIKFILPAIGSTIIILMFLCDIAGLQYYAPPCICFIGLAIMGHYFSNYQILYDAFIKNKYHILLWTSILVAFFVIYQFSYLSIWDDLAFWAPFSKEMFANNTAFLTKAPLAILDSHYHYPRGPAYFHYYIMYFSGFSEQGVLFAHFLMHVVLAAPFLGEKNPWQGLVFFMALFLFPIFHSFSLIALYNDSTIGFACASLIATMINIEDKFKAFLLLIPTCFALTLYREIGLWIGICAITSLFPIIFLYNKNSNLTYKISTFFCMILLPILSYQMWFAYVDQAATLGREAHKLEEVLIIIQNVISHDTKSWIIITSFFGALVKGVTSKKSFLILYSLILYTSISLYRNCKKLFKEYWIVLLISILGFGLFLLFRLYIYILMADIIYATLDGSPINVGCVVRYSASYTIIFMAINLIYLGKLFNETSKKILFSYIEIMLLFVSVALLCKFGFKDRAKLGILFLIIFYIIYNWKNFQLLPIFTEKIFLIIVISMITSNFLNQIISIPRTYGLDKETRLFHEQSNLVSRLVKNSYEVEINFAHESTPTQQAFVCYALNFYLSPYYRNEDRKKCLQSEKQPTSIEVNKVVSNLPVEKLFNKQKNCKVKYYPHLNHVNINCK